MRKLIFKYAKAVNFLCFGTEGIELFFDRWSNIVNVFGKNLDTQPHRSNGTGKSTIPEIIVYALYGKTIKSHKKIKHENIINNKIRKKLYVEVHWDEYKVVRTRKPTSLRFWKNGKEETTGSTGETQKLIDQAIGLNYETFTNIVIFNDKNTGAFLECDAAEKRLIVENLLSLEIYRDYFKIVKDLQKELKDNIKFLAESCEELLDDKEAATKRVNQIKEQETNWKTNQKQEFQLIVSKIKSKKEELEKSDIGTALSLWQNAQTEMNRIILQQNEYETKKTKLENLSHETKDKLDNLRQFKHKLSLDIQTHQQTIKQLESKIQTENEFIKDLQHNRGTPCSRCRGIVTDENCNHAVGISYDMIANLTNEIAVLSDTLSSAQTEFKKCEINVKKVLEGLKLLGEKQTSVNNELLKLKEEYNSYSKVPRPDLDANCLLLEQEITELMNQAETKKNLIKNSNPYIEILKTAVQEAEEKQEKYIKKTQELNESNSLMPYYDYWVEAFGDSGIRKLVIDGITPDLNESIAYWLGPLMSDLVTLKFDSELNETIENNPPDGDPFVYAATSAGEQKMLNLSVSQAFSRVMMMSWGAIPSIIFLDEVGSNMDDVARQGVYNMVCELAKDRQVFITTHDKYLLDLLQTCTELHLEKKNGFTKLVNQPLQN